MEQDKIYLLIATFLFAIGFVYGFYTILRGHKYQGLLLFAFIIGGFAFQTLGLNIRGAKVMSCPLGNLFEIIQFISWSLIMAYIIIRYVLKLQLLELFTTFIASALSFFSFLYPQWDKPYENSLFGGNKWIEMHAALAVFSYGIYALMAAVAVMYLIQHYSLKRKLPSKVYNFLPSISSSLEGSYKLLLTALLFYSISAVVGSMYWFQDFESISKLKFTMTIALWAFSISLVFLRKKDVVFGEVFAWLCLLLFNFAILTVLPIDNRSSNKTRDTSGIVELHESSQEAVLNLK